MTVQDILKEANGIVYQDQTSFYVRLEPRGPYDNRIYVINKKTLEIKTDFYSTFIWKTEPYSTEIEFDDFKKLLSKLVAA